MNSVMYFNFILLIKYSIFNFSQNFIYIEYEFTTLTINLVSVKPKKTKVKIGEKRYLPSDN